MAKKRAKVNAELFSGSNDLFGKTDIDKPTGHPRSPSKDRLSGRATYDIGEELKEVIRAESVRLGVPASQLAKYLLLFAWEDYAKGEIPPPTLLSSDSPAYRNIIEF